MTVVEQHVIRSKVSKVLSMKNKKAVSHDDKNL